MAAQQHEQGGDPLDRRALEVAEPGVVGGEAAGRDRRHGVADRVERAHPGIAEADRASDGQQHVDHGDLAHDLGGLGQELARPGRQVDHEQLQAADAQVGQDQDREGHQPEATQPDQEEAPEQDAPWR